jgi:hypothetical protein
MVNLPVLSAAQIIVMKGTTTSKLTAKNKESIHGLMCVTYK